MQPSLLATALVLLVVNMAADAPPEIELILDRWETASSQLPGPTRAAQKRAYQRYRPEYNAHEVAVLLGFRGPVRKDRLLERYDFKVASASDTRWTVLAIPRDDVERLFCPRVELTVDRRTHLPVQVTFIGNGPRSPRRTVAVFGEPRRTGFAVTGRPSSAPAPETIQLVSAESNRGDGTPSHTGDAHAVSDASPPDLDQILNNWTRAASEIETFEAHFQRYVYDKTFLVETRTRGRFYFEAPDKGRLQIESVKIPQGAISRRTGEDGQRYVLKSGKPEVWVCTGRKCVCVHPLEKTAEVYYKPKKGAGLKKPGFWGRLPDAVDTNARIALLLIVGAARESLTANYDWGIVKVGDDQIRLKGVPISDRHKSCLSEVQVVLDRNSYETVAIKYVDPAGTKETVYIFHDSVTNGSRKPFQVDLTGYRILE